MSHFFIMDPDIPLPSIEHGNQRAEPTPNTFSLFRDNTRSPRASSSPDKTPFKTPLSHPATPATIKTSPSPPIGRNGRLSTPTLRSKRSTPSLPSSRAQTPSGIQLRRVSSNLNPSSPTISAQPLDNMYPPSATAESVAKDFFKRELEAHPERQAKTVVIVHDSCYGHRFSRPRTSKAALSTIVERPERIHAILLGVSTAYVRMGERHADGAYGPHLDRDINSLPRPPFLLKKTTRSIPLNHPAVTHVHGGKWMEELQIMCDSAEAKLAMNGKELQRPLGYGKDEDGNNLPKLHEGDLYLCSESLAALQGCLGGVCDAVDTIFAPSITNRAFVCIRPPGHHCSSNYPSGFCWLNNVHVGISYAAMNHGLTHAAIIDFDLHHGDGSQTISWDHNHKAQSLPKNAPQHKKTPIGYYSLHDINSYPCEWGDEDKVRNASLCIENAHGQSIWNVHLEPWSSLEHFWHLYESKYTILLQKTRSFLRHHADGLRKSGIQPKSAIFLSAGFDASQWEGQGMQRHNVNVPTDFYARFTADIIRMAEEPDLGVDGRVVSVLEGGYSDRALMSGALSHLSGLAGDSVNGGSGKPHVEHMSNGLSITEASFTHSPVVVPSYEPAWWSEDNLEAIENRVAGNSPPPAKRKDKLPGTYSSPTQASTARMTNVARERTSLSARLEARHFYEHLDPEPPQPVDWVTASYELSRLLIPTDRQTLSCRHDELNAGATKVRRERLSAIGVAVPTEKRMQLRTRGKGPVVETDNVRTTSRSSNRRTTIAVLSELPDASMPTERPRRRSSAASSILSSFQDLNLTDTSMVADSLNHPLQALPVKGLSHEQGLQKAKMAPPARKPAMRTSSPRKAKVSTSPASNAPQVDLQSATGSLDTLAKPSAFLPNHSRDGTPAGENDMNHLTGGMKKVSIKLKMPTPAQHAENQKKADDAKSKKTRVARKPPVTKASTLKGVTIETVNDHVAIPVHSGFGPNPTLPELSSIANGSEVGSNHHNQDSDGPVAAAHTRGHVVEAEVPPSQPFDTDQIPVASGDSLHIVPDQENILAAGDVSVKDHSNLKKTKGDLPLFTSSSPIPFAPANRVFKEVQAEVRHNHANQGVPDRPGN